MGPQTSQGQNLIIVIVDRHVVDQSELAQNADIFKKRLFV